MRKTLALIAITTLLSGCLEYSNGERVGTLTKFSKRGFFCKTWEGEMLLGGMKKVTNISSDGKSYTSSMAANTWHFTVEDPALVPVIQQALSDGRQIKVTYSQEIITFCRSDSDNYFVTTVQ